MSKLDVGSNQFDCSPEVESLLDEFPDKLEDGSLPLEDKYAQVEI